MAKNCSFSSLFNLQSKSINFILVIFGQNTKVLALLFGQKSLIFITCQSAIKINQFHFGHFWPKYQGFSLTFWPKVAHFHHLSICNQNQSISILVSFGQNTKVIALLFGQKSLVFITCQSAIKINQFHFGHFWPKYQGYSLTFWPKVAHFHHLSICNQNQSISILVSFGQNTKVIALLFGQKSLVFITCQSAIKINQFHFGHFWPKYQGYSLTFWPKIAHFHHFSICNQNQSISILVSFGQNTKVIALLCGQKSLIVITCQSAIKINQFQFWSVLAKIPRL